MWICLGLIVMLVAGKKKKGSNLTIGKQLNKPAHINSADSWVHGFDTIKMTAFSALRGGHWHFWMLSLHSHYPPTP